MTGIKKDTERLIILPHPPKSTRDGSQILDELLLNYLAAVMLYPEEKDILNRYKYMALACNNFYTSLLKTKTVHRDKLFPLFTKMIWEIFSIFHEGPPNIFEDIQSPEDLEAQAWSTYHKILREAHFPISGKGSVSDRYRQGLLAGLLLTVAHEHKESLNGAAKLIENEKMETHKFLQKDALTKLIIKNGDQPNEQQKMVWESIQNNILDAYTNFPTVTAQNITQNIWPSFKRVAHFWAALLDFNEDIIIERNGVNLLTFAEMRERRESGLIMGERNEKNLVKLFWPSKSAGWRGFVHKAEHVFNISKECRDLKISTHKPLLSSDECWQIIFKNMSGE